MAKISLCVYPSYWISHRGKISWKCSGRWENPSEEELPFSIGGHPAFNRPKNCKIRFDVAGPLTSTTIVDGLVGNGTVDYELEK